LKIKDRTLTLWAEQENETTALASVPQRQVEEDPTKKIGWHTGTKKFLRSRCNKEDQTRKHNTKRCNTSFSI
jgi:hypothetical protein